MTETDEESGFVDQWVDKLSHGKPFTLPLFLEFFQSEIKCKDRLKRESALKRICLVISKLPQNYPWQLRQVELLMKFFLLNYSNFDTPNYLFLAVLKKLLICGSHLENSCIETLVETLFSRGQVQTCAQKERYLFYQILDILLDKYCEELSRIALFTSYFISSISGERDPRCLILVFRLFCIVCKYLSFGNFPRKLFDIHANDLFDAIACYYPIDYKQNSRERTEITKELLVSGCECCLLVDEQFAPFVFELIIEKFTDDEYSLDIKLEVCSFLAKACAAFPCSQLLNHIDQLCAGIRLILFNFPKSTYYDCIPEPVDAAVSSMLKTLEKGNQEDKKQQIEHICQEFIEKSKMFMLQTELGLTDRILAFFEILLRSSEFSLSIVFESVFSCLLSSCKGDTASYSANKSEVINESLRRLCHWIDMADNFKQNTLIQKYHIILIGMLDKYDREIAQLTRYKLLKVCLNLHVHTDGLFEKCKVFLRKSFNFMWDQNKELRNSCIMFVHAFAAANWPVVKSVFVDKIDNDKEILHLTPLLWSVIHDAESFDFASSYLITLFPPTSAWIDDFQEILLHTFEKNKSGNNALQETLLRQTLSSFFVRFEVDSKSEKELEALAEFWQQIGLVIDDRSHLEGLHLMQGKLRDSLSLLPALYLYIIQSAYSDELLDVLALLVSADRSLTQYKSLIMAAAVNKSSNYVETLEHVKKIRENLKSVDNFKCKARLCAALFLVGHPEGLTYFAELLYDLVQSFGSKDIQTLIDALVDMLAFDSCHSDPAKCKYRKTFLWRQRIFCQLVPIYVQCFNDVNKESENRQSVLFPLLSPFFTLAISSTAVMNNTYIELLPVLCAALDTSGLDVCTEGQVISGLAKLLENATAEQLGDDFLLKVMPRLQNSLDNNEDMTVHLASLKCLQLVAQQWSSTVLLPFYSPIVRSLTKTSGSRKRIVRKAVADVRNLWELLPTK